MVASFLVATQNSCFTAYSYASIHDTPFHSSSFIGINATTSCIKGSPSYIALIRSFNACAGIFAIHNSISLNSSTTLPDFVARNSVLSGLVLLFVYLYVCYGVWKHRRVQKDSKDPKTWPILGSQLEAATNYVRLLDWITGYFRDDHRTVKMSFLSRRSYLTVDPANVEHILKSNFQNYPKGEESHYRLFDLLGNGILNTDGSMWKTHRKLGSLEFSIKKLRHLSSTVYKSNALSLLHMLNDQKSSQGVDMQELLLNMTFNSICEVVFGSDVKTSVCEDASIASALDNVQEMITRRYVFPWWRLQKLLNIGSERILHQDITTFNKFLTHVINRKRAQMQEDTTALATSKTAQDQLVNGDGGVQDLLSRFILHQEAAATSATSLSTSRTGQKKRDISEDRDATMNNLEKEVREAMMSFVMAGRDTTASTLSWFLYCMCTHPHMQEEVFQELIKLENNSISSNNIKSDIDSINLGMNEDKSGCSMKSRADDMKDFAEKVLSYEALQSSNTPYLHASLAETLRLYPAVPRDGKVALRDDVLPDGTLLKAGDQVAYIPYAMGRMPFLWGDDAILFRPERWLANGTFQPQSPFKFTAFQAGPRMCLGKDAAYLQMKITAAMLLRFFHFKLVPNHPVEYRMMMVMTMKHGLRVQVTPR